MATRTYWAAEQDPRRFAGELEKHRKSYEGSTQATRRANLWRRAASLFYGSDADSGRTSFTPTIAGYAGEMVQLRGNILRALVRQMHVMTTGARLAYTARPVAYDAGTTELVTIANAWCDRILDDHAEQQLTDAALYALIYGEGWVSATWDHGRGRVVSIDPMTGTTERSGEWRAQAFRPDQVVRDPDVDDMEHDWIGVLRQHSRWSLLKRFPQHERAILGATEVASTSIFRSLGIGANAGGVSKEGATVDADRIVVLEWYHRPTDALPEGRVSWLIGDTLIADGPNRYGEIPVFPMISSREPTGSFGYGEAWDLMGLQQWYDSVLTQILSTREAFGLKNVFVPSGADLEPEAVSAGLRLIRGAAAPVAVDLEGDSVGQGAQALGLITGIMQTLTGLNDAALGNAGKSASGAALAMMSQLAAQFNSGNQRAYAGLFEAVMSSAVRSLHTFSTEEHVVHVIGRNRQGMAKRFVAADFAGIDGIRAELGNPAMRSVGMRKDVADQLLAAKLIPSPDAYLEMIATGRTEPMLEGPRALEAQIERENEILSRGEPVRALVTDNHAEHIRRHCEIDPAERTNEEIVNARLAHAAEHAQLWASATLDPVGVSLLAATGQQPSPAAAMLQAQAAAQMAAMQGQPIPGAPAAPDMPPNPEPPQGAAPPAPPRADRNPPVPMTAGPGPVPGGPQMPRTPPGAPSPDA